jgi:hypothetical protein
MIILTEFDQQIYLTINEEAVEQDTCHKGHIRKLMFLCAVRRPKFNANASLMVILARDCLPSKEQQNETATIEQEVQN